MILSYNDILSRIKDYNRFKNVYPENNAMPLIENFKDKMLQSASYDLSITAKALVQNSTVSTIEQISSDIPKEHLYRNKKTSKYQNEYDEYISSKIYDEYDSKSIDEAKKII